MQFRLPLRQASNCGQCSPLKTGPIRFDSEAWHKKTLWSRDTLASYASPDRFDSGRSDHTDTSSRGGIGLHYRTAAMARLTGWWRHSRVKPRGPERWQVSGTADWTKVHLSGLTNTSCLPRFNLSPCSLEDRPPIPIRLYAGSILAGETVNRKVHFMGSTGFDRGEQVREACKRILARFDKLRRT